YATISMIGTSSYGRTVQCIHGDEPAVMRLIALTILFSSFTCSSGGRSSKVRNWANVFLIESGSFPTLGDVRRNVTTLSSGIASNECSSATGSTPNAEVNAVRNSSLLRAWPATCQRSPFIQFV